MICSIGQKIFFLVELFFYMKHFFRTDLSEFNVGLVEISSGGRRPAGDLYQLDEPILLSPYQASLIRLVNF